MKSSGIWQPQNCIEWKSFFHVFYGKILLQRNIGLLLTLRALISFLSTLITKRTQEIKNQHHVFEVSECSGAFF